MFGMELPVLLQAFLLLIQTLIGAEDLVPFYQSSNATKPEKSIDDEKLAFVFGNSAGERRVVEIYDKSIPEANLTTLVNWLHSTDELKSLLGHLKTNRDDCIVRTVNSPSGPAENPTPEKFDESIKLVEEFEKKIEAELRDPKKSWNYPAKKE